MVNINPPIEVYCTRPTCKHRRNFIPEELLFPGSVQQQYCRCCGMPLILQQRFLPTRLLVPDEERESGFGRTFLAKDLNFPDQQRIVKQLHPLKPPKQPQFQKIEELFRRESEVLQHLNHPQIPRALDFAMVKAPHDLQNQSTQQTNNQQNFFYLVQQYIEGQNLAQEIKQREQFSETEVMNLLQQILPVLEYIHTVAIKNFQGLLHRDIKPSNIMRASQLNSDGTNLYLIDFGAVKQVVVAGAPIEPSCVVGTEYYAPPEQLRKEPLFPSSDLYSLAVTCVCLLTGKPAEELRHRNQWDWRQYANLSNDIAEIIDQMLSSQPEGRLQSAQEVIDALRHVRPTTLSLTPDKSQSSDEPKPIRKSQWSRKMWRRAMYAFLAMLVLVFAFAIHYFFFRPCLKYSCNTNDNFSWGEQVLLIDENKDSNEKNEKNEGTKAFVQGDYKVAIDQFKKSLKSKPNDPETLIDLNNAIATQRNNPIRIAVSIPINDQDRGIPEEMLRGVAHVQTEVNCGLDDDLKKKLENQSKCNENGIHGRFLQVWIANDQEDPKEAEKVAGAMGRNQDILGVIGPYSSKITSIAGNTKQQNPFVLISPASTVSRKRLKLTFNKYVFRTAYTDSTEAGDLVSYMRRSNPPMKRAVIIKHPDRQEVYSDSLSYEFKTKLKTRNQEQVVETCIVDNKKSDSEQREIIGNCIRNHQQKADADVVLVALARQSLQNKEDMFFDDNDNSNLKVLGGDTMYSINLTKVNSAINERLVVSVPWSRSNGNDPFEKTSEHIWGAPVNWRTAMTYDATKAMVEALKNTKKNNPSRQDLYVALSQHDFSTQGATGKVEFCNDGDRKPFNGLGVLVKVKVKDFSPDPTKPQLDFVIMATPKRNESCL